MRLALATLTLCLLAACGQAGPLVLPDDPAQTEQDQKKDDKEAP